MKMVTLASTLLHALYLTAYRLQSGEAMSDGDDGQRPR